MGACCISVRIPKVCIGLLHSFKVSVDDRNEDRDLDEAEDGDNLHRSLQASLGVVSSPS